ncbi:hypothetical protein F0562_021166 [Nyssa sinensis]|uniref:Transcription factor MYC/MYB N-terminal domain-containing protein n=1 Tax=Nyssa sinensis TaxID=561372 RepID=A0A5J5BKI0_9ASTE|nr:hypothetical protein F0562_021166 [Nyssa sinensis]
MGEKFWLNEEEKAMVEAVVGNEVFEFLASSASDNVLSEFVSSAGDLGVRQGLCKTVEGSNWTYTIFWQVSRSKSGNSALIWGDEHFREPKGSEVGGGICSGEQKLEKGDTKKWVLQKLHACFGGSEKDDYAETLDSVSDVEMLYLTSMYYSFPFDMSSSPAQHLVLMSQVVAGALNSHTMVSGFETKEDSLIRSDERKPRKRGRKPANGREDTFQIDHQGKEELNEISSLESVDLLSRFLSSAVEDDVLREIREKSEAPVYEEVKDMVYTHASLCESMRLYPLVPVDSKEAMGDDVLPDGTVVKKGMRVTYHPYAMGRVESVWGSDWAKFRPERWLERDAAAEKWSFVARDSYTYPVFQAGSKICLGKEMAFLQMKRVVASVLRRFRVVPVVEDGVEPVFIVYLTSKMKGGFSIRIEERAENF